MWKKTVDNVSMALVAIGGINWGLVGVANYNLVEAIFSTSFFTKLVYTLVGVSAIWLVFKAFKK